MGRHQHPLSCTGAPTQEARAAQDDPMPGYMLWLCHGLASDAAGSSVSTGAQPAPLLVPSTLLAPRTGSLGHGTGLSHGTASPAAAAGALLLAPAVSCGLRCCRAVLASAQGLLGASRDAGHSTSLFHLCHVMIAVSWSLLFTSRGAAQLRAVVVGLCAEQAPRSVSFLSNPNPGPLIFQLASASNPASG